MRGWLPNKFALIGWALIGAGVGVLQAAAIREYKDDQLWADAAKAEEEVEAHLRRVHRGERSPN